MGIIILPFLLGAFVIGLFSLVKLIKLIKSKDIGVKEMLFGLLVSLLIFGLICVSYIVEGQAWALSPAFRIPIVMVFIPFLIQMLIERSRHRTLAYISKIVLSSLVITVFLGVIFNDLVFGLIDHLGIAKHY